jgi:hypothetical protein
VKKRGWLQADVRPTHADEEDFPYRNDTDLAGRKDGRLEQHLPVRRFGKFQWLGKQFLLSDLQEQQRVLQRKGTT